MRQKRSFHSFAVAANSIASPGKSCRRILANRVHAVAEVNGTPRTPPTGPCSKAVAPKTLRTSSSRFGELRWRQFIEQRPVFDQPSDVFSENRPYPFQKTGHSCRPRD